MVLSEFCQELALGFSGVRGLQVNDFFRGGLSHFMGELIEESHKMTRVAGLVKPYLHKVWILHLFHWLTLLLTRMDVQFDLLLRRPDFG